MQALSRHSSLISLGLEVTWDLPAGTQPLGWFQHLSVDLCQSELADPVGHYSVPWCTWCLERCCWTSARRWKVAVSKRSGDKAVISSSFWCLFPGEWVARLRIFLMLVVVMRSDILVALHVSFVLNFRISVTKDTGIFAPQKNPQNRD